MLLSFNVIPIFGVTTELNPWDAYSPGRFDQHLNPFYQKDVEEGILDEKKALELLECLWVKFNNQPAPPKVGITLKESSTYTDFAISHALFKNFCGVFLLICTLELGCSSFISSMQSRIR